VPIRKLPYFRMKTGGHVRNGHQRPLGGNSQSVADS
jgi:hypothetical protein